jgi:NADP-dependent 3-hydroxy acid dehydrogenase YdfG
MVTQALLPLLRQGRGRVVCISSICGRSSTITTGSYCASKFAVQALADAWRLEVLL